MNASSNTSLLSECALGETAQILSLKGGLETKLRLVNLGFHSKGMVKILSKSPHSFIVNVDGNRFAIGADIAKQIEVEQIA